jgi:hypothetical protein
VCVCVCRRTSLKSIIIANSKFLYGYLLGQNKSESTFWLTALESVPRRLAPLRQRGFLLSIQLISYQFLGALLLLLLPSKQQHTTTTSHSHERSAYTAVIKKLYFVWWANTELYVRVQSIANQRYSTPQSLLPRWFPLSTRIVLLIDYVISDSALYFVFEHILIITHYSIVKHYRQRISLGEKHRVKNKMND